MPSVRGVLLVAAVLAQISVARADPVDDCNSVGDMQRQLRGCTAYINTENVAAANLATAYINRANVYAQQRQPRLAIDDYAAAMALDAGNPLAPYNRGNLYFDMQRYDLAVADYTRAIELDSSFGLAFLNRGSAYAKQGNAKAAAADYAHATKLDATLVMQVQKRLRVR
jgi:tetratricopeptide (TPR) repeat protein